MNVFVKDKPKTKNTVFRLPVDTSIGPNGIIRSEFVKQQSSLLYPLVTNLPKEEVMAYLDAGIVGPLQAKAEAATKEKRVDVYNEVIEVAALGEKSTEDALVELETLRETNPFLNAYVSPAVIEALKQSENPTARKFAQGKLSNVLIAAEVINNKMAESGEGFWSGVGDFFDVMASDLPVVSSFNVERRKELSDRFVQILDSNEDPEVVTRELKALVDEAADMGFFTDANRFYMNDFLGLTLEQGAGQELTLQRVLGATDILLAAGALGDTGKLIGMTRRSVKETSEALAEGVAKDSLSGPVDPSTWRESAITPERVGPRPPVESQAVKEVELDLQARAMALDILKTRGDAIDDELFEVFKETTKAKIKKDAQENGKLRLNDVNVDRDGLGNVFMTETFGTSKGKPFAAGKNGLVAAQKYADQIGGAEAVEAPQGGWLVAKKSNLPTGVFSQSIPYEEILKDTALYGALSTNELGRGFWARWGSSHSQTDAENTALMLRGEGARARANEEFATLIMTQLSVIGKEGELAVGKVFKELRDGSLSHLRQTPSTGAFSDYFFTINKRTPTADEVKFYQQVLDWNDTDFLLSSDIYFKNEVNRGVEILIPQDGIEAPAIKISSVDPTRQVWDADAGKYVNASALSPDRQVYQLVNPMEFGGKPHDLVATATPKTRALKHTDVMGYNVGGSRLYERNQTNWIIKQDTETVMADGVKKPSHPRTVMVAKTEKEANKAVDEINTIIKAVNAKVNPKAFAKAEDYTNALKTVRKDTSLNDIIARVSGWNTDVHTVDELVEFALENNIDLRTMVSKVGDGEPMVSGNAVPTGMTYKDVATAPGLLKFGDFRKDKPLMGYGGKRLNTVDPLESINQSLMMSMSKQTNMAYETKAIMKLFRTALANKLIPDDNVALVKNMPLRQKVENMRILTSSELGKKLELERQKILTRTNRNANRVVDVAYHKWKDNLSQILWDKDWRKFSGKIDSLSSDPDAARRGIVFDAYFFGAIDQIYVQASQIFAISAMADKVMGAQAAAMAPVFRLTLRNGHPAVEKKMAETMSFVLGVSTDQVQAMLDTFRLSGKGAVMSSVADLGEDTSTARLLFRKVREKGRVFYTEGELISRVTAHMAASKEYLAKFGADANLRSQKAINWVTTESDRLTHAMSSTNRHPLEQLPFMQFQTYTIRNLEFMLGGLLGGKKVLSNTQKVKLATTQLALFGVQSVPFVGAGLAFYEYMYGIGVDQQIYDWMRKGTLDAILEYMTGVETDLGQRIAWGEGLFNTMQDLGDKSVVEMFWGPTGTFATNIMESINQFTTNLKNGTTSATDQDIWDIAKNLKFVNMYHNAYLAFKNEQYQLRNSGDNVVDGLTRSEAFMMAMGIPLEKVNAVWDEIELRKKDTEYYKEVAKKINRFYNDLHIETRANGWDTELARNLTLDIETLYAIHSDEFFKISPYIEDKFITMYEETVINRLRMEAEKQAREGATE